MNYLPTEAFLGKAKDLTVENFKKIGFSGIFTMQEISSSKLYIQTYEQGKFKRQQIGDASRAISKGLSKKGRLGEEDCGICWMSIITAGYVNDVFVGYGITCIPIPDCSPEIPGGGGSAGDGSGSGPSDDPTNCATNPFYPGCYNDGGGSGNH